MLPGEGAVRVRGIGPLSHRACSVASAREPGICTACWSLGICSWRSADLLDLRADGYGSLRKIAIWLGMWKVKGAGPQPVQRSRIRSGFACRACLMGMHVAYVAVTIGVALANGYAAALNFVGAKSVKIVADDVRVPQKWMIPFGILLAFGAAGLLAGFAVPVLGTAAAVGLVAYFICALSAHVRVRDLNVAGAVSFLVMAVAALVVGLGYQNRW